MSQKYELPSFLAKKVSQRDYSKWLQRKATTHLKRDRKRGNKKSTGEEYKIAIHKAVLKSRGYDSYTGERLKWDLISTYDNRKSKAGRRKYKKELALLPSVDHVGDGTGSANFKMCSWRTNDCKNDLSLREFKRVCRLVLRST